MTRTPLWAAIGALLAFIPALPCAAASKAAAASALSQQRQEFLTARQALRNGDRKGYLALAPGLTDYPLYPFLAYWELTADLGGVNQAQIDDFEARYGDSVVAERAERAWLFELARREAWPEFLARFRDQSGTALRCHYLNARLRTGQGEGVWPEVERLWLVGKEQPDSCDPLFAAWERSGGLTRDKLLERMRLAMLKGETELAERLADRLPAAERPWLARWKRVQQAPLEELKGLPQGSDWGGLLFAYALQRIARRAPLSAAKLLEKEGAAYPIPAAAAADLNRYIALKLAYNRLPTADKRLAALPAAWQNDESRQWRVRAALWNEDWPGVLAALDALAAGDREEPEWRYWRGVALLGTGEQEQGRALLAEVARCGCYYGFLAADRLGIPVNLEHSEIAAGAGELEQLAAQPGGRRVFELRAVGLKGEAAKEWRYFYEGMPAATQGLAAKLAQRWNWLDMAIYTLAKSRAPNDLTVRFPTPFEEAVRSESRTRQVDPSFVYAIMRQESAFRSDAKSPVGALGLMQLMPATARATARLLKSPLRDVDELLTADNNIHLGTAHLRWLLDRFSDNRPYVAAGYNAGPHRVKAWQPKDRPRTADIWIADIPFDETRNYVQKILAYSLFYEWRLGREPGPISRYLPLLLPGSGDGKKDDAEG